MASSENNIPPVHETPAQRDLDTGQIRLLVSNLEQDLAGMPDNVPGKDKLRNDIESLKKALAESGDKHGTAAEGRSHSLRASLQNLTATMEGEVLKDSRYIAEIGRILGMV